MWPKCKIDTQPPLHNGRERVREGYREREENCQFPRQTHGESKAIRANSLKVKNQFVKSYNRYEHGKDRIG